jgi:hypothetical protein
MARLDEVKTWMLFWGWSWTDGTMLKRDGNGTVIAHRGDMIWEQDLDKAIDLETKLRDSLPLHR